MSKEVLSIRQSLDEELFYRGEKPLEVEIKNIGLDWQMFSEKGDYIKALDTGDDPVTVYLYKAPKDLRFPPHFHTNSESVRFLEGAADYSYLDHNKRFQRASVKKGQVCRFDANIPHKFHFTEDSFILITYYPEFKNNDWEGHVSP